MLALKCFAAFIALFITDLCWAIYLDKVKAHRALESATWAVFLFLTGASAVISYTENPWLLIPAAAGAFFGTLAGVVKNYRDSHPGGKVWDVL